MHVAKKPGLYQTKMFFFFGVLGIIYDFKDCLWQSFGIWCGMMILFSKQWRTYVIIESPKSLKTWVAGEYVVLLACFLPISNRIPTFPAWNFRFLEFPAGNFLFLEFPAGNDLFLEFPTHNFKLPAGLFPNFRWEILKYRDFIRFPMGFTCFSLVHHERPYFTEPKPY